MNQNHADSDEIFGAFLLGSMALALPMTMLREVVPFTSLQQLPTAAPWVLGGLDLRGVLVPVVDLCVLLGQTEHADHRQCVVIVAHDGHLAGVVATAVDCLFSATIKNLNVFHGTDPVGRVARGSLQNPASGKLLSVLCVQSLMALPQLPAVSDPEPHRLSHALSEEHAGTEEEHQRMPLLLMRSQGLLFAVNPEEIETTMPRAQLQSKDVSNAHYKGNTIFREREIPAISLIEYLDMGPRTVNVRNSGSDCVQPAFVLRFGQSAMAVLIDEILDIVHVNTSHLIDLPQVPALKTNLLRQAIATRSIYPEQDNEEHFYVIHPPGLVADPRLSALADLVHEAENSKDTSGESAKNQHSSLHRLQVDQRVIVFDMNGDHAIPIGEIAEVLPYRGVKEAFPRDNPFRGIMTHRNRAIPVVDLAQHLGLPRQQLNTSSNVLVVQLENQPVGLAVGCLRSIEQANWSPEVPVLGAARDARQGVNRHTQKLAEVLVGNERKMLEVISARQEAQRFADGNLAIGADRPLTTPVLLNNPDCPQTADV